VSVCKGECVYVRGRGGWMYGCGGVLCVCVCVCVFVCMYVCVYVLLTYFRINAPIY
jgi:hypothetical protein